MDIETDKLAEGLGITALNEMQKDFPSTSHKRIVLLAPTGSGKTLAFIIGLLRHLSEPIETPQALVLAPSRELAQQIAEVFRKVQTLFSVVTLYGGHALKEEINELTGKRPDVIIATPGRLLDHIQRETINLRNIHVLIIDEMDKCMDLGFLPDIKRIIKKLPCTDYFVLSSATMPQDKDFMKSLGKMEVHDYSREVSVNKPRIEVVEIPSIEKDKIETLVSLLDSLPVNDKSIVFANHRESAERIHNSLKAKGFPTVLYHGALDQKDRELALIAMKNGSCPVLVATDLAARGLDIPSVENVIHYHLPVNEETYVHRNGRTARAGADGKSFVIRHGEENIPNYINPLREWYPGGKRTKENRDTGYVTLVFNLGKKEKISKGDIVGFLTKQGGLDGKEIGRIEIGEHYAAASVPTKKADNILKDIIGKKLKNQRVIVSEL